MFSSGFYMFIYCKKKKKMNCFVPAKGTHQVAYGLEGVWSLTCRLHRCRWFRCCVSNLIIGSFHRL